jgi:S1-C subfamily serine protease
MSSRSVFSSLERKIPSLCLILLCAVTVQADDDLVDKFRDQMCRVFEERKDATVRVEAYDRHGKLCGTGFFADPAGTVYTLASIVANAEDIFIVQGDRKVPAKLLMADPRSGIALIKADINSPFIPVGDPHKLSPMTPVVAIGFPVDLDETAALGMVSSFDRKFLGRYFMTTHIRAILAVQPGFGGAPLLNLRGEVVGIVFSGIGVSEGGGCYAHRRSGKDSHGLRPLRRSPAWLGRRDGGGTE